MKSCLAFECETWHCAPIFPQIPSSMVLLPLVQNKVIILIGGEINSKGLYDSGATAAASDNALKKYFKRCQCSVPILPLKNVRFGNKIVGGGKLIWVGVSSWEVVAY